ncbi:MAG: hypothetical protein CL567_02650 [Alphaproteobacteria bacterium]|nr:hypothetical protein [Alphaproteobacteria bacterium]
MQRYIKTKCGLEKLDRLKTSHTLIGKIRLWWFVIIASIRDTIIKN